MVHHDGGSSGSGFRSSRSVHPPPATGLPRPPASASLSVSKEESSYPYRTGTSSNMKLLDPASAAARSDPSNSNNKRPPSTTKPTSTASSSKQPKTESSKAVPPKKRRVRTGCLTCRERHLKCDEATPTCNNCLKSHRVCRRGIKLNFMETKLIVPPTLVPFLPQHFTICDESRAIAAEYKGGLSSYPEVSQTPTVSVVSTISDQAGNTSTTINGITSTNTLAAIDTDYNTSLGNKNVHAKSHVQHNQGSGFLNNKSNPNIEFTTPNNHDNTQFRAQYPKVQFPLVLFHNVSQAQKKQPNPKYAKSRYFHSPDLFVIRSEPSIITDPALVLAFRYFIKGQAIYLDYMVPTPTFQKIVPTIALSNPMLFKAIAACGAYNYGRLAGCMQSLSNAEAYYKEANVMLYSALKAQDKNLEVCLLTALLITVYEMSFEVTRDLTSHIFGVKTLLEEFPIHFDTVKREVQFSSPLAQATFWVLLHCDISAAFLLQSVPLWNPNEWGPSVGVGDTSYYDGHFPASTNPVEERRRSIHKQTPHFWYRRALYILYRICTLRGLGYDPTLANQNLTSRTYSVARQCLFDELHDMLDNMPSHMQPLFDINVDEIRKAKKARYGLNAYGTSGVQAANATFQGSATNTYRDPNSLNTNSQQVSSGQPMLTGRDDESSGTEERVASALSGTPTSSFSQIFFTDPMFAVIHSYILSAMLSLHSLRPNGTSANSFYSNTVGFGMGDHENLDPITKSIPGTNKTEFGLNENYRSSSSISPSSASMSSPSFYSAPVASPFDPNRVVVTSADCMRYARRLVGIITSSAYGFQIGSITAWSFMYVQPYISDQRDREFILTYFDRLCTIGWSSDKIKGFIIDQWEKSY